MILKTDAFRKLENFNSLTFEERNLLLNLLDKMELYGIVWTCQSEDVDKTYEVITKFKELEYFLI